MYNFKDIERCILSLPDWAIIDNEELIPLNSLNQIGNKRNLLLLSVPQT